MRNDSINMVYLLRNTVMAITTYNASFRNASNEEDQSTTVAIVFDIRRRVVPTSSFTRYCSLFI